MQQDKTWRVKSLYLNPVFMNCDFLNKLHIMGADFKLISGINGYYTVFYLSEEEII